MIFDPVKNRQYFKAKNQKPEDNLSAILTKQTEVLNRITQPEPKKRSSKSIDLIEALRGDDGEDGYTPIKGKDYFTQEDINQIKSGILKEATPVKGKHYFTSDEVDQFKKEITPKKGVDYYEGRDGVDGYTPIKNIDYFDGKDGLDGRDAVVDEKKIVKAILKLLPDVIPSSKLDEESLVKQITEKVKDALIEEERKIKKRFGPMMGGGTLNVTTGGGGGGLTPIVISGAVNGSNLTFTSTTKPTYIVSDGVWYTALDANSNVQWSYSAGTITLSIAPPNYSITGF